METVRGHLSSIFAFGRSVILVNASIPQSPLFKTLLTGKDPEALECLVRIMETSGEKLDHQE